MLALFHSCRLRTRGSSGRLLHCLSRRPARIAEFLSVGILGSVSPDESGRSCCRRLDCTSCLGRRLLLCWRPLSPGGLRRRRGSRANFDRRRSDLAQLSDALELGELTLEGRSIGGNLVELPLRIHLHRLPLSSVVLAYCGAELRLRHCIAFGFFVLGNLTEARRKRRDAQL